MKKEQDSYDRDEVKRIEEEIEHTSGNRFEVFKPVAPAPTASARVFAIQEIYDEFLEQYTTPKDCGVLPPDVCWTWVEAWAKFYAAAQSAEVERLSKERDAIAANRDAWKNDAQYAQGRLSAYEACKGLWLQCLDGELVCLNIAEQKQRTRAEAAESKLSQLQLSNEVIVPLDDFKMARQWVLGAKCVCGKRKGWMHAFCDGCYSKLVPETKSNIYRMFRRKFVKLYVEILREKLANGGQQ